MFARETIASIYDTSDLLEYETSADHWLSVE
jgi:hypothetical protein